MECPEDLKYTKSHEWVKVEGDTITVGLTDYAQESLGDIVHIELPEEGREVQKEETFGVVESVKAVSDLYSPVDGKILESNSTLMDSPETTNEDPYGEAWMVKIKVSDAKSLSELMDCAAYKKFVEEESNK